MEVLGVDPLDEVEAEADDFPATVDHGNASPDIEKSTHPTVTPSTSKASYPAITAGPHQPSAVAPGDKGQKKGKGLTPEQKQKLEQMQQEQEAVRKERVANVSQKLLQKISVWTETDRSTAVTEAFQKKMQVDRRSFCSEV
jgi:hypothetical protein